MELADLGKSIPHVIPSVNSADDSEEHVIAIEDNKEETSNGDSVELEPPSEAEPKIWDGPDDAANPLNWPTAKKWRIVAICCLYVLVSAMGSSVISPAIPTIKQSYSTTSEAATLALSLYVLGWATGPLVFAPASEVYGRNIIYNATWLAAVLLHLGAALADNLHTLLICRALAGVAVSSSVTLVGGTFTDMFVAAERGPPAGLLFTCGFLGPVLGPLFGGFLTQYTDGWVWTMRFLVICAAATTPFRLLCPETHAPTILERRLKARAPKDAIISFSTIPKATIFRVAVWRPLQLLTLEPIVLFISLYGSLVYSILYLYMQAYPRTLREAYGWKQANSGAAFSGIGVGVLLSLVSLKRANQIYIKICEKKNGGRPYPEGRLPLAMAAGIFTPVSIFWFAWSAKESVHWIAPVMSGVFFGWSMVILFTTFATYLTDTYSSIAASALAAHNVLRCLCAFALSLLGPRMYENLGNKWATSLLGFLALGFAPLPFVFYRFGPAIRAKSRFKPKYT